MTAAIAPAAALRARPKYRWAWIGASGSVVLLVALMVFLQELVYLRGGPLDFGPRAVWFVWVTGDPPVVAREPGGGALPGKWARYEIGRGGFAGLRGRPIPRNPGGPPESQRVHGRPWVGGRTGEAREIDGVTWYEWARWGGLPDLDELRPDAAFVGRWKCFAFGFPEDISLGADGSVHADGVPRAIGRWAGRGRLLLLHRGGWRRADVYRFVLDPSDPLGDRFVLDEGCHISEVRRVR